MSAVPFENPQCSALDEVNEAMSTYRDDSEVVLFNRHAGTDWFAVSVAVVTVVTEALEISRLSDGAFDVTVNPLVDLWGFGAAGSTTERPPAEKIAAALERTGYRHLEVRLDPPALRKDLPELSIDLHLIDQLNGACLEMHRPQPRKLVIRFDSPWESYSPGYNLDSQMEPQAELRLSEMQKSKLERAVAATLQAARSDSV